MSCTQSQGALILRALKKGHALTPVDGFRLAGTMKLATRIGELRKDHPRIKSKWVVRNGKTVKQYWIPGTACQ
jgi:hypothetical protein